MRSWPSWARPSGMARAGALAVATFAVALIVTAGTMQPWDSALTAVLEAAVGASFVVGAAVAPGPVVARFLFGLVGMAWLGADLVPRALLGYLGVLAVALVAFPTGRPRSAARWTLAGLAMAASLAAAPKPILALVFGGVAVVTGVQRRRSDDNAYPVLAGLAVSGYLAASWVVEARPAAFDETVWTAALELILIAIAIGFPVAARAAERARLALADLVLGDDRLVGLGGLEVVLRDVLDDPSLRVHAWDPAREPDPRAAGRSAGSWLVVHDGEAPIGFVAYEARTLADPAVSRAVEDAVRLAILNVRWQSNLDARLRELESARARVVAATDRQRSVTAERLREEIVEPITQATADLARLAAGETNADAAAALAVARGELEAATTDVLRLVAGIPPAPLGDGGLAAAVRDLAARCPVPVRVSVDPGASGSSEGEAALFYVCSEALTNTVKHAAATRISVALTAGPRHLRLEVVDNGIGGAQPSGSGLTGLADRLAAAGGRLQVDSPPGAGTTLTAEVPL